MIDNTEPQNDRFWTDALGLVLFSVGAITCALLTLALMDGPGESVNAIGTAAMGHGLLWIGGPIPVGLMGAACLMMGAAQFLGWVEAHRMTRHLTGALAVAISLGVVLGAFSESAGGLVGLSTGGALANLISSPIAALVGLGALCLSVWGAWLAPSKATAWEKALEIEKPAVPLQASADGVTTEESAALSFEGAPAAYPGIAVSPYPEDVRSRGEIPEGASVLGAKESLDHDEITDESSAGGATSQGDEASIEAEPAGGVVSLESEVDGGPVDDDLVESDPSSGVEEDELDEPQEDLNEEEPELDEEEDSESEEEELEEAAELEEEVVEESEEEDSEELEEEEDSELEEEELEEEAELEEEVAEESEEEDSEELEEEEDSELEEEELEEAAELEEEVAEDSEEEDSEELEEEEDSEWEEEELEEAAELEEEVAELEKESAQESVEGQGDLFSMESGEEVPEVVLEPQAAPLGGEVEVEEPAEADQAILMKAADLFLERERVAVSLLQRQFNMDFEECCVVLDRLQEMGLIGPYLGGNRRDILLTRDEWLERVSETT